jgi:hypothetical protein
MTNECRFPEARIGNRIWSSLLNDLEVDRRLEWVDHLRGCSTCRRRAIEEDPTLVFSLLEPIRLGEDQIGAIQRAVETLRRSRTLDAVDESRTSAGRRLATLVACVVSVLLLLPLAGQRRLDEGSNPELEVASQQPLELRLEGPQWAEDGRHPSVIEDLSRPGARVYQLTEDDLALVMIVDETLDL